MMAIYFSLWQINIEGKSLFPYLCVGLSPKVIVMPGASLRGESSQALGSAITYARRYSLYSALGIYPDKDDDGAAMRDYAQQHTQQQKPNMLMQLIQHYRDKGVSLKATASALMGRDIQTPAEIPANLYKQLYNMI